MQDNKALWLQIWEDCRPELGEAMYLGGKSFYALDGVHEGVATIISPTKYGQEDFLRRAIKPLKAALAKRFTAELRVQVVVKEPEATAQQRVYATAEPSSRVGKGLFDEYTDLMDVIDRHPSFTKVTAPLSAGGWELFQQALTNACKAKSVDGDLATGVEYVLAVIEYVGKQRNARSKAAIFWSVLKNGIPERRKA